MDNIYKVCKYFTMCFSCHMLGSVGLLSLIVLGVLACSLLDRIEILSRQQNATRPQCIINIPPELRREAG
jgi:hypothetical protein